ncbi:nitroreductase family deazaflavin-dependent oxidoreductase [Nocardia terpenica]|uniref:Nitroreductase n=1 Tax=Nocardia terpenica TaxID=455432 RepID=A0A291RIT2_9NOCA|nr:nitroreductase family deazaflavin-dependent oxidoreductase [Nocardia terpenica]ATL67496.1 nitroreductase [Nocardia terpenica]MBF6064201.1 nitroreductase family deazaflavin-dependent oxidoreductase [Nocardia terpenica]MBF6106534.1 nitroreductase family deazaflavin-dependent oxidoreductase [Nocardia terpenica]MBF6113819.1 nitroreductase family deazaflavin-dependent oxidoreductase [Nocardia terpenica]MBF6120557.1 nitroreductase family deazaflavin-dependent oxidoreductase [Nocardia terpenica]
MLRNPLPAIGRALARRPLVMRAAPAVALLERCIRTLTRGRHGVLDLAGVPSIELTVLGRKSGLPRTVALLYIPDGPDTYLLVGSNWGRPDHPSWSANLNAADHAEIHTRGERFKVRVNRLTGPAREAAWHRATTYWPGYTMEERLAHPRQFRLYQLTRI